MSSCTSFSHFLCHYQNTCTHVCACVYYQDKAHGGIFFILSYYSAFGWPINSTNSFPNSIIKIKKNTTYIRVCLLTAPHPQLARAITQWVGMCISPCGRAHPTT